MNYYLQDQNKSPVKSRSTSLTLREHIQKWTNRLNTLFILKHLRDLKVLQCCWCTERHHWSPTADPRLHHVMWQRLRGNVFLSITTTVNLHYWKKWKISRCALYMINNFLFELSKNIKLHNNTNTTTQRPEEMFVDNGLYHQFDTSIFSSMEK